MKENNTDELNQEFINDKNDNNENQFLNKSADDIFKEKTSDNNKPNQYHNIYFALIYLISCLVVGVSCAYYFSYNNYNNRIFLPTQKTISPEDYPFYKIRSKYTKGNCIYIELEKQENPNNEEKISNDMIKNLNVVFEFFVDSVNIKMGSNETKSNLNEEQMYNLNDLDFSNKKINNYKESNINVTISDYPFNFFFQRKEDGAILFNSDCSSQNQLSFSQNYKHICSKIEEDNYFFGLGDDMINHGLNLLIGRGQKYNLYSNVSDVLPIIISYNKLNMTSSGIFILNSGPMRIRMYMDKISMVLTSGEINLHILAGSSIKQVISQIQNSLGLSMIPPYSSIEWDYILKNTKTIHINNDINLDDIYYKYNNSLNQCFNDIDEKELEGVTSVFLDSKIYGKELEDEYIIDYLFLHKSNKIIKNEFIFNNLNSIGLIESKYYNNLIMEKKGTENQQRPLIFSSRGSMDSNTYTFKLIKDIPFTYEGIPAVMRKLKSQTISGNTFCYIKFDSNTFEQNKDDEELILRWSQLLSLLPFANMNNLNIPLYIKNFRYIFSLYLYINFITIATEGGSYFRPLFYDLKSSSINEDLISKRYQIMLGSNLLIEPVFDSNLTSINTLLTEDLFYNFYTGEYINKIGDGYYKISFENYQLPLFLRGGKITPVQLLDELLDIYINSNILIQNMDNRFDENLNLEKLKDKPLQLLIALDNNLQAQGNILIDDFSSNDIKKKKNYYKMLITVSQRTSDISIFFKVYSFKYNLPGNLYKNSINKLIIYGFTKFTVKKITIMNKSGRKELDHSDITFIPSNNMLIIPGISIPLNVDTKILIV